MHVENVKEPRALPECLKLIRNRHSRICRSPPNPSALTYSQVRISTKPPTRNDDAANILPVHKPRAPRWCSVRSNNEIPSPQTPQIYHANSLGRYDTAPMPIVAQHAYVLSDASALSSYQQQHHTYPYHASSRPPHPHYYQPTPLAHPHHPRVPIPMPASNHSGSESPQANKRKRSRAGCYTCRRRKVSSRWWAVRAAASTGPSHMR